MVFLSFDCLPKKSTILSNFLLIKTLSVIDKKFVTSKYSAYENVKSLPPEVITLPDTSLTIKQPDVEPLKAPP